jgi:hypothetical protein
VKPADPSIFTSKFIEKIKQTHPPELWGSSSLGGIEHRPVAPDGEAQILLFGLPETRNTGNVENELTMSETERLE